MSVYIFHERNQQSEISRNRVQWFPERENQGLRNSKRPKLPSSIHSLLRTAVAYNHCIEQWERFRSTWSSKLDALIIRRPGRNKFGKGSFAFARAIDDTPIGFTWAASLPTADQANTNTNGKVHSLQRSEQCLHFTQLENLSNAGAIRLGLCRNHAELLPEIF
jgi:hypothetical protein